MNIVLASFLFTIFLNVVKCRILNKTILIQQYGYSEDALLIDLNGLSIDSIEIGTFKDFSKLEVLYLDDNKISKIENGLLNNLSSLKELWLESNTLIAIDKNSLVGLNSLKLVCLYNNPISNLFPSSLSNICETNKECTVKILDKCIRKEYTTSTITTTTLTTTKNAGKMNCKIIQKIIFNII